MSVMRLNFKPKTVIKGYPLAKKGPSRIEIELPVTAQIMGVSEPERDLEHVTLWVIQHSEDVEPKITHTFLCVRENEPFDIDENCEHVACFHAQPIGMWAEKQMINGVETEVAVHLLEVGGPDEEDDFES